MSNSPSALKPVLHLPWGRASRFACSILLLAVCLACQADPSRSTAAGAELFTHLNCLACHAPAEPHRHAGPDLAAVLPRLQPPDLENQLRTPRRRHPDSRMPSFAFLRPADFQALLAYLHTFPKKQ